MLMGGNGGGMSPVPGTLAEVRQTAGSEPPPLKLRSLECVQLSQDIVRFRYNLSLNVKRIEE